ncbi:helicase-related protein [Streptomyces canus]|uniref:DEAD/DEAH box helicase n=1 Tax=Streptomyces canus TaxID=58343 RepID=UPI003862E6D2|nr:helicase-related protein [Streptomyces canus]
MRKAVCKDCLREERAQQLGLVGDEPSDDFDKEFVYNEQAAQAKLNRGQTRSDRCKRHRARHRVNIQGMAVPYIDLQTIGEAIGARDPNGPTGPFGGLGPMPEAHTMAPANPVDLGQFGFGMDESDIHKILDHLARPDTRIVVVKAGTGTGKSTYMPYRLLDPPEGAAIHLADLGPIIVTEPRVQATTGVAGFVGSVMSGAGGVGPGFPVGFQVSGDRAHDDSCQLVYVTDGTMINWLREGRLSTIGTVVVDEAHERSTNIDFIMGYLKKAIDRYPHLRVIVTSATFDATFYQWYFGGPDKVGVVEVPAVKTIGYGFPLFPDLDAATPDGQDLAVAWQDVFGPELPLRRTSAPADREFVTKHFQKEAPPLKESDVARDNRGDIGWVEDLHEVTTKLLPLRFHSPVPESQWKEKMPTVLGEYIVKLVRGLDTAGIYGDVLGFLPTGKSIEEAVAIVREGLGIRDEPDDPATVYALLSSLEGELKVKALAAQGKGHRRKIVISTNLAETSLTVEGVRFVVDSGLIAQSEWDPRLAQGGIPTKPHSQAGIRQRWGRVGRKSPGWVFPLYTKAQFLGLPQDTPPGSARSNLEQLIMTAKLGGIDNVVTFDWPAKFLPPAEAEVVLDESALQAREIFLSELQRADEALRSAGAVDPSGDPTVFGKELSRAPGLGSTASTIAIMHADRLACVPEVVTILKLLDGTSMVGLKGLLLDSDEWPDEWRLEAAERHRALATGCQDDAELVLQVMSVWERTAPGVPPWEPSAAREQWARRWWINHELLLACAQTRREVLESLSPAMKEEVKRFTEPALVKRARGAITRAMSCLEYRLQSQDVYRAVTGDGHSYPTGVLGSAGMVANPPSRIIPLRRTKPEGRDHAYLSNIITLEKWALPLPHQDGETATGAADAIDLLVKASRQARPETGRDVLGQLQHVWPAGLRVRLRFDHRGPDVFVAGDPVASVAPAPLPALSTPAADERGSDPGERDNASEDDASPELDTSWPTPVATEPDPGMRVEVLDIEEHERALLACQDCERCRRGDLDGCLAPLRPVDPSRTVDELAGWRERASRHLDVSRPQAVVTTGQAEDDQWYEVVGYDVSGSDPKILLRPDWRHPGVEWMPAVHPGTEPGQVLEVVVGPEVSDHRGALRVLWRPEGANRFVLREAPTNAGRQDDSHQLALSLHRRTQGLLASLKEGALLYGHVIPRPQESCSTLTLLGLLSGHWHAKENRYERRDTGTGRQGSFYQGVLQGPPNPAGYVTAQAALHDPGRGIVHLFGTRAVDPDDATTSDAGHYQAEAAVLIQVRRETVRIAVAGIPAPRILGLIEAHPTAFHPLRPPEAGDGHGQSDVSPVDAAAFEVIPKGWLLASRGPVPTQAARDLAALNPGSREWISRCWYYWARSHHLATSRDDGLLRADAGGGIAVEADRRVLSNSDRAQLAVASLSARAPAYWIEAVRRGGDRIADLMGAQSIHASGHSVVAAFGSPQAADGGRRTLARALASAAAAVQVPERSGGALIGKGGHRVQEALATPGVWFYAFDNRTSSLLVIAEPAALGAAVRTALSRTTGATGRLTVSTAAVNGRLIGKGGSVKQGLLDATGCTFANPITRESNEWTVRGPSPQHVMDFIHRAGAVVPCTGEVTEARSAVVTDLASGRPVTDPWSHTWSEIDEPDVELN